MTTENTIMAPCPTWCTLLPGHPAAEHETSRRHIGPVYTIVLGERSVGGKKNERRLVVETYAYQEEDRVCPPPTASVFGSSAWGDELDDLTASDLKQLATALTTAADFVGALGGRARPVIR